MSYTLDELIEKLQDLRDDFPELAEEKVHIAMQENYPIAGKLSSVTVLEDDEDQECDHPSTKTCDECPKPTLWLGVSNMGQLYAPQGAWND